MSTRPSPLLALTLPALTLCVSGMPRHLAAQGLTTAAMEGVIREAGGPPIEEASIRMINESTGRRWEIVTAADGRYVLEGIAVGGPYRVEARALGFAPEARTGIVLALGQRLVVDFHLQPTAIELPELIVIASADGVLEAGRTGPAEVVSRGTIAALPNPGRDFLTLTVLSPHARFSASSGAAPSGGISVGGQNRLYNSFQIDGGLNHDAYLGRLPGRETLPRPISLEALEEIQVLVSPFDVRHGSFAGGLVNAVTRSGTNAVHGSLFGYMASGVLVGDGSAGSSPSDFTAWQYGGSIGGPIVRDRAHYFVSLDVQRRTAPDPGPLITDTVGGAEMATVGVRYASATRFQDILRITHGLDPGELGPIEKRLPAQDVFGKVTVQLGTNSHLEASHHFTHGNRLGDLERRFGFYELSSATEENPTTAHASRLIWTQLFRDRWSHELIVSHLRLSDRCRASATYPRITVLVDRGELVAGPTLTCPGDSVEQRVLEVTENITTGFGSHVVSFGARAAWLHFEDGMRAFSAGWWRFRNLDSLQAGQAFRYERSLPGPSRSDVVQFPARELGVYAQDRWSPIRELVVTAGLRLDGTLLPDAVPTNEALQSALGIDTGRLPSRNILWSPRLGINYDFRGKGRTFVRGGLGLFSGRPPYRWLGNAYRDYGDQHLFLICEGTQVPPFDPINQPATCGAGPRSQPSFLDHGLRLPQNLKLALGVDHRLMRGVIGSVDLLYTRAIHQLYVTDANLLPPSNVVLGEGGRPLYGTIDASGTPSPPRRDPTFGQVIRVSNRSGDRALTLSAQLRMRLGDEAEVSALYAHTRARDRMSILAFGARGNLQGTPLDGTLEERRLATSYFETPHRALMNAVVRLPYRVRLSLLYAGASGMPFTYVIDGDANADGIGRGATMNDIVYVPRDAAPGGDLSLVVPDGMGGWASAPAAEYARLEAFIEEEPCLRAQRGRILARNSCRNPWFGTLNARLTKAMATLNDQSLELTVDVYNVLNLMDRRWGQSRVTTELAWVPLLRLVGYDPAAGRGIYELALPARNQIQDDASRWQVELSARYLF